MKAKSKNPQNTNKQTDNNLKVSNNSPTTTNQNPKTQAASQTENISDRRTSGTEQSVENFSGKSGGFSGSDNAGNVNSANTSDS